MMNPRHVCPICQGTGVYTYGGAFGSDKAQSCPCPMCKKDEPKQEDVYKPGYLDDKAVYLCGGMCAYADSGLGWREAIKPILKNKYRLRVYDPTHKEVVGATEIGENKNLFRKLIMEERWEELKKAFDPVVHWDLRAVDKADLLIVYYDPAIHTVGTIDELRIAVNQKKPILVKYDKEKLNLFNPWMSKLARPEHLFRDWKDLFAYLDTVNSGIMDEEYWSTV